MTMGMTGLDTGLPARPMPVALDTQLAITRDLLAGSRAARRRLEARQVRLLAALVEARAMLAEDAVPAEARVAAAAALLDAELES